MWFKQATLFEIRHSFKNPQDLSAKLEPLAFTPCLPSLPSSVGWINVRDNDALVYAQNGYWMLCMQFEEKILPAGVVNDVLVEKVRELQQKENRLVRAKEKQSLKEEIIQTLLPKAFTKKSRVYGYIDIKRNLLVIDSNTPAKIERFTAFLKRAISPDTIEPVDVHKPSQVMTRWLKQESPPRDLEIGEFAMMQDPSQFKRVIRAQQQNLMSPGIQLLLKESCEIIQLALSWKDQLSCVLTQEFSIKNIKFQEAVVSLAKDDSTESDEQRFDADFVIMTEVLGNFIESILAVFQTVDVPSDIEEVVAA